MVGRVECRQVDEEGLEERLAVAVEDAAPEEVMPPVAGPPGWTLERREAFRNWHRARRAGLAGPLHESTFAVIHDGKIVGSARLALRDSHGVLETSMWLARSWRGHRIGTAALRILLHEAARAGERAVVADTKAHHTAALAALRRWLVRRPRHAAAPGRGMPRGRPGRRDRQGRGSARGRCSRGRAPGEAVLKRAAHRAVGAEVPDPAVSGGDSEAVGKIVTAAGVRLQKPPHLRRDCARGPGFDAQVSPRRCSDSPRP